MIRIPMRYEEIVLTKNYYETNMFIALCKEIGKLCTCNEHYRIGIAITNLYDRVAFMRYLAYYLSDLHINQFINQSRMSLYTNQLKIIFDNGSYIEGIPYSDTARGKRYNCIIAEDKIDEDYKNCILRPSIRDYVYSL